MLPGLHFKTYHKAMAPRIIIGRLFPTLKVDLSLCIPIKGLEIKVNPANRNEVTHANWALSVNSDFFRKNFIFANSVKRHICDAKNSQIGHDLRILVNDRVISAFREDFIFTKLRICKVSRK